MKDSRLSDAAPISADLRRAAEHDVAKTLTKFFNHLDSRNYDSMWDLMGPNGYWDRSGEILDTKARFSAAMDKRPEHLTIRHLMNNLDVEIQGDDSAEAVFCMVLFRFIGDAGGKPAPMTGPTAVSSWTCELNRLEGHWKISALKFTVLFQNSVPQ